LSIGKRYLTTLVEIGIIKVLNVEKGRRLCFLVESFVKAFILRNFTRTAIFEIERKTVLLELFLGKHKQVI